MAIPEAGQQCQPDEKTILLAEDEPTIQLLITTFLRQNGFRVLSARDGSEALALAQGYRGEIHLLLTDVQMPGMDGPTLALELTISRPAMKTLLMSGDLGRLLPTMSETGLKAGLLQKPFGLPKLLEKVHEMTASRTTRAQTEGGGRFPESRRKSQNQQSAGC